ncbi:hypothetical protein BESB_064960 [Besnoitia besnoiti]|uniref:Uncharacterized protein n=1 Tax=Besnoitia besnoiti TaxID=94643 RepID=A0A2A9M901_BESBE|nr:hypothetical protein BESB_064960 [Besnoitia besnoiti]PFH34465.1 hypothetical protein BESB_064960 [Besnoitia besnoiti]
MASIKESVAAASGALPVASDSGAFAEGPFPTRRLLHRDTPCAEAAYRVVPQPSYATANLKSLAAGQGIYHLPVDEFTSLSTTAESSTPAGATPTARASLPFVVDEASAADMKDIPTSQTPRTHRWGFPIASQVTRRGTEADEAASASREGSAGGTFVSASFRDGDPRLRPVEDGPPPGTAGSRLPAESSCQSANCPPQSAVLLPPPPPAAQTDERSDAVTPTERVLRAPGDAVLSARVDACKGDSTMDAGGARAARSFENLPRQVAHLSYRGTCTEEKKGAQSRSGTGASTSGDSGVNAATLDGFRMSNARSMESDLEVQNFVNSLSAERDLYRAAFGAAQDELEELQGSNLQLQKALGDADRRLLHSKLQLQRQQRQLAAAEQRISWESSRREDARSRRANSVYEWTRNGKGAASGSDPLSVPGVRATSKGSAAAYRQQEFCSSRQDCATGPSGAPCDSRSERASPSCRERHSRRRSPPEYLLSPSVLSASDSRLAAPAPDPSKTQTACGKSSAPLQKRNGAQEASRECQARVLTSSVLCPLSRQETLEKRLAEGMQNNCGVDSSSRENGGRSGLRSSRVQDKHGSGEASGVAEGISGRSEASMGPRGEDLQSEGPAAIQEGAAVVSTSPSAAPERLAEEATSRGVTGTSGRPVPQDPTAEGVSSPALRSYSCDTLPGLEERYRCRARTPTTEDVDRQSRFVSRLVALDSELDDRTSLPSFEHRDSPKSAGNEAHLKEDQDRLHGDSGTSRKSIVDSYSWLQKLANSISAGEYPSVELLVRGAEEQQQLVRVAQAMEEEREQYVDAVANLHSELRSVRDEACIYLLAHQQQAADLQQEADEAHGAADFWLETHLRWMKKWQRMGYGAFLYLPSPPGMSAEEKRRQQQELFQSEVHRLMAVGDCGDSPTEASLVPGVAAEGQTSASERTLQSLRAVDAVSAGHVLVLDDGDIDDSDPRESEADKDLSWAMPDDFVRVCGGGADPKGRKNARCAKTGSEREVQANDSFSLRTAWLERQGEKRLLWFLD